MKESPCGSSYSRRTSTPTSPVPGTGEGYFDRHGAEHFGKRVLYIALVNVRFLGYSEEKRKHRCR